LQGQRRSPRQNEEARLTGRSPLRYPNKALVCPGQINSAKHPLPGHGTQRCGFKPTVVFYQAQPMDGSRANRLPYLTPVLELVRRFRTLRRIHLLAVFFDGGSSRILPPASGRIALCSTPCSLAGLPAELPLPAPTVAEVGGHESARAREAARNKATSKKDATPAFADLG
jgi:hypothetical protein